MDVRHTVQEPSLLGCVVQELRSKGSLHQMGPTEAHPATPDPHRSAGSPYMACQKRDTVIVLGHYKVTRSGCKS